jgi:ATP-dependent Clp protease ATP-binding subunit ClpC
MYAFERFTERAKKTLTLAQEEAEKSGHSYIGTEHLLLGLLRGEGSLAYHVLKTSAWSFRRCERWSRTC